MNLNTVCCMNFELIRFIITCLAVHTSIIYLIGSYHQFQHSLFDPDWILDLTSQGSGLRTDLPSSFLQLTTELESLRSRLIMKPPAWCRSIVNTGEKLKLLNVDTSTRGLLGKNVEKQLRVVKLICEFERAEESRPNFMKHAEWTCEEDITGGVLALADLHSVMVDNDVSLGMAKEPELCDFLATAAMKATDSVRSELVNARKSVTTVYGALSSMLDIINQKPDNFLSSDALKNAVKHFNSNPTSLRTALEGQIETKNISVRFFYRFYI